MSIANKKRIRKITNGVILPEGSVVDSLNGNSSVSAPSVKAVKEAVANASGVYLDEDKTNLYLNTDGFNSTLTSDDLKGSIQGLPIGSIIEWSSLTPPTNYLICDGSWVSQATYADLYAVIGHTYDGDTSVEGSFRLPNRCGKVGVGYDADNTNFNALGKTGGEETHTLTVDEMPNHNHKHYQWVFHGGTATGGNHYGISFQANTGILRARESYSTTGELQFGNEATGGGKSHNNLQPYETTIFVIKYKDGNMFSDEYGGVVIDNLNSTSTKDVLSAYQGKVLNDTKLDKSGGTIDGDLTVNGDCLYYGTAGYVGSNGTTSLHIQGTASNYISVKTTNGKGITISGTDGVYPSDTDTLQLGAGNKRWNVIYCKSGSVTTSDRTHKDNIADIDNKYMQLFDKLKPVTFEYNYETSDRTHVGFISQDVKESMDEVGLSGLEFAGYCRDENKTWNDEEMCWEPVLDEEGNPTYIYSLRYSEFIALNTKMIQLNKAKLAEQEAEITSLKSEIAELKEAISQLKEVK